MRNFSCRRPRRPAAEVAGVRHSLLFVVGLVVGLAAGAGGVLALRPPATPAGGADFALLQEIDRTIESHYYVPVKASGLRAGAIDGLTSALGDPYTVYYTKAAYERVVHDPRGRYGGVGVEVDKVLQGVEVEGVFPNTPAAKAAMQPGDVLLEVNGHPTQGWSVDEVADALRGAPGSTVSLVLERGGNLYRLRLRRATIPVIPTASAQMLPGGIGFVRVSEMSASAAQAFRAALKKLAPDHPRAYVLDLRDDPGGDTAQAVAIARDIIPHGTLATLVGRRFPRAVYTSESGRSLGAPLVVLVNSSTASAAEILAAAIAENGDGTLMGTRTYGKGVAQELFPLGADGYLALTVAQWLTPRGASIQGRGIEPGYVVAGSEAPLAAAATYLGQPTALRSTLRTGQAWLTAAGRREALDVAPVVQGGRLYLSAVGVEQATGVEATFDAATKSVTLRLGRQVLDLVLGSASGRLDGRAMAVAAPKEIGGQPLVPAQDLVLAFHVRLQDLGGGSFALTTSF